MKCWVEGQCKGVFVDSLILESKTDCYYVCKEYDDCQWFTYDSLDSSCVLFEDCTTIEECVTCESGQRQCSLGGSIVEECKNII